MKRLQNAGRIARYKVLSTRADVDDLPVFPIISEYKTANLIMIDQLKNIASITGGGITLCQETIEQISDASISGFEHKLGQFYRKLILSLEANQACASHSPFRGKRRCSENRPVMILELDGIIEIIRLHLIARN